MSNKLFLTGAPRLSAQRRDRRPFRPQQPLSGPVYTPSSRFTFNPFDDADTDEVSPPSPYTHYYYYDPATNSPALAFATPNSDLKQQQQRPLQPACNITNTITSATNTSVNLNLNPSLHHPSAPSRTSLSRSPSPPSPNSFPSFYPPSYPHSPSPSTMSLVDNQSQSRVANRSPSPPSPTRRRAGAMSLGPAGGSTGNDYSRVRSYSATSVSSPYAQPQPHPSSKGFTPLSVGPTPATPRLANRTLNHQHQPILIKNNNTNVVIKKPIGRGYPTASRGVQQGQGQSQGQAILVSSGRTNPPAVIERPGSAPPALLTTPTAHSTATTTLSSSAPTLTSSKPAANRSQPKSQSSIYTLLSRPLPASSRDTIAGIVASMLLSRGDTPSVGRPRRSSALGGMGGCGGNATSGAGAGYVKSGLSRVYAQVRVVSPVVTRV
ncbi:hypothetical protein D9758_019024 [Tetrapyrgos nigripes]|uniref:Uncharacterized protein n=1 Tax=Tetrapyrgos nigripes TaxID=182062 RepID=A0A8H5AVC6_9AGAR|nr:hypothetical protein D9758_019024 [Tetrapyrgos nigripes]